MAEKKFKKLVKENWPKTKKELEKVLKNTMTLLTQGEEYLKEISKKGIKETKKLSIKIKKEKLYYELGKIVAKTAIDKWATNPKIKNYLSEIKKIAKKPKSRS